jgi:organic hydroperoxide reductase OsmC/OhrA
MMKVSVTKARVHVTMRNKQEGSVLQCTVKASCLGIETRLEIESEESPERVAALVRNAENGCFTMQALLAPVRFTGAVTLNGSPLSVPETEPAG